MGAPRNFDAFTSGSPIRMEFVTGNEFRFELIQRALVHTWNLLTK